jgi:hypothetical protein
MMNTILGEEISYFTSAGDNWDLVHAYFVCKMLYELPESHFSASYMYCR